MFSIPRPRPGWRPQSPAVTVEEFDEVVWACPVQVVHFWATWNGYDPIADECLQRLRKEFEDRIHFRAFDVDTDIERGSPVTTKARVLNLPALGCFVRGEHHETLIGLSNIERGRAKLREWAELGAVGTRSTVGD